MSASIINATYNDLAVSFNTGGWFNATQAAAHYGKEPNEWLRLPSTQEYREALERRYGKIPDVKTSKARSDRGGGTWLSPKLAVRFAQWLDVDFAIWCDEQIDALIRGTHTAFKWQDARLESKALYRDLLAPVIEGAKLREGKQAGRYHYINEGLLIAEAVTGERKGGQIDGLSAEQMKLRRDCLRLDAKLLAQGLDYQERKAALGALAGNRQALEVAA
jgi:hypothetical protein